MKKLLQYDEVSSVSQASPVEKGFVSPLNNSYPTDYGRALETAEATPTVDGDRARAFARAGLR